MSQYIDSRSYHLPTIIPTTPLAAATMGSQDVEMTSTEMILVKKIDGTQATSDGTLLGRIEVEAIHSQAMILPTWIADLYSSVTGKIDQLEEALRLAQINQRHLDEDYPGLISQYHEMLHYQHRLFGHAVAGTQQLQRALAAEQDQICLETTAFATQVQGALICLEQASSDAYQQLRQAWIANTNQVTTLRDEFDRVIKDREEATDARRRNQRAEIHQLNEEIRKLKGDMAQCQEETTFLDHQRQQMVEDWERCHHELAATS